jgi:hypothetical protein
MKKLTSLRAVSACAVLVIGCLCARPLTAHGLAGDGAYQWREERAAHMPVDPVMKLHDASGNVPERLFYVVVLPNRWPNGSTIRACFYGGSNELRQRIVAAAQPWFDEGNIKLDAGSPSPRTCVAKDKSQIRIGFNEPGYWSYIGTDGVGADLTAVSLSSMNLQGFDTAPPEEPAFSGYVLHEFGHALGLHHEHQSPSNTCASYVDWTKLYSYYQRAFGWDQAKVDNNLKPLMSDHSAYDWSTTDPDSIMIYASDKAFLKDGTPQECVFHDNYTLSSVDKEGIRRAYSRDSDVRVGLAVQAASLDAVIKHGAVDPKLKKALSVQRDLTKAALALPVH